MSDLRVLSHLQLILNPTAGDIINPTLKSLVDNKLWNLVAAGVVLKVDTESVRLRELRALTMIRGDLARLECSMEGFDHIVERQLKLLQTPSNPSIDDLDALVRVRDFLLDAEAGTYMKKLDELIARVTGKLSEVAAIEQRVKCQARNRIL